MAVRLSDIGGNLDEKEKRRGTRLSDLNPSRNEPQPVKNDRKVQDQAASLGLDLTSRNNRMLSAANKMITDNKAKEKQRQSSQTPYERFYEEKILNSPVGKLLTGLQKADRSVSNVKAGALDTATLGASQGIGRAAIKATPGGTQNLKPIFENRLESPSYSVGEFGGYLLPGTLAERGVVRLGGEALKRLKPIAQGLVRGGAAGTLDMAAQELGDVAFREGTYDPQNVALGTLAGGGLGAAIPAIGAGLRAAGNAGLRNVMRPFLDSTLAAKQAIDDVSRANLPNSIRRTISPNRVPEVFPERFRRDFSPIQPTPDVPTTPTAPIRLSDVGKEAPVVPLTATRETPVPSPETTPRSSSQTDQLDRELEQYKRELRLRGLPKEESDRLIKAKAMKIAAQKRELAQGDSLIDVEGGLTAKELGEKIKRMRTNYVGKEVIAGGVEGKIKNTAFGRIVVEFPDGTTRSFTPSEVKPKFDVDEIIRQQKAAKEAPTPPATLVKEPAPSPGTINATQGIRANFANQLDNRNFSPELQAQIRGTDQTYEVLPNQETVNAANRAVSNLDNAKKKFLTNEAGGAEYIATGYRLMQELDALGRYDEALAVSRKLAEDLTKSGQTVQAASIIARLSPEGQLLNLIRVAEKNGRTVSVSDSVKFKELASEVQDASGAGKRANEFNSIIGKIERGEKVSEQEVKTLSDYLTTAEKKVAPKSLPKELNNPRTREKIVSFLEDVEKSALERIAARKNNLNAIPLDEWADHALVVAAQVAKGTIKAETYVEDLVKMFGEKIRPVAAEIYSRAQDLLGNVSGSLSTGDIRKADAALKRLTGVERTPQSKAVDKFVREQEKLGVDIKQSDIDRLRQLSRDVSRLSDDDRIEADIAMQRILASYEKSSLWDKVQALRYISMLLNTSTQAVNAISGPTMATAGYLADIFGTMVDIVMSKALNKPRTTTLYGSNPFSFMARYFKNLKTGTKAGWHGVNPAGIQSTNEIRGLAFPGKYNPFGILERSLGAVSKGADYATYRSVYQSEMLKQGYLDAVNKGIKGKQNIKNHVEAYLNDPPEEAVLQADRIGKNTTFQRSDSLGGQLANWLNAGGGEKVQKFVRPAVNTIMPFVRTPINIASTAVTLTPAGIIKGLYQLARPDKYSQREAIRTLSLGLTGTGGLGVLGYYLNRIGVITGANDTGDANLNNLKEQAGEGKYRFNTSALQRFLSAIFNGEGEEAAIKAAKYQKGDKQFDYNKLQPLAFPLAAGASLYETKGKPTGERVQKVLEDSAGSLFGMSSLRGLQTAFQPDYQGSQGNKSIGIGERVAESFFKSFSPGFLAQEAKRQDPIQRKTSFNDGLLENVTDYYKSRTPGLSQSLPPRMTTLGQTYTNPPGVAGTYANPYRSEVAPFNEAAVILSALYDRTGDKTIIPTPPEKTISGKRRGSNKRETVTIPEDRYAKYQEDVGQEIVKRVSKLPTTLSDDRLAERVRNIFGEVKEKYRNKLKRELGIVVTP